MARRMAVRPGEEASALWKMIFHTVSDAILLIDQDGWIIGANQAVESLTGWRREELTDHVHFCQICKGMADCTEQSGCSDCFFKQEKMPSFELMMKTKSGREFPVAASSTRLPDEGKRAMVVVLRDMSEQKQRQHEQFRRMMSTYMIQAQEEERKRISRDLHDGIGQALYSVLIGLKVLEQHGLPEAVEKHLSNVRDMAAKALEEAKRMAVELRPSTLDDLGLVPAIRSYAKRYQDSFGIMVELKVTGWKRRLSAVVETALYRICQEALTNAAKYAGTDRVHVCLRDRGDQVRLLIRDEGRGFDVTRLEVRGSGLGLYGMRERAHLLGGQLQIDSAPGRGTAIHVVIPVDERGEPLHVDPPVNC
ncbi:MAG: PAS domain S-box protein [Brevibacillus sp.]|nr:PAS domain S-box protein [Brevibacillus sp.]